MNPLVLELVLDVKGKSTGKVFRDRLTVFTTESLVRPLGE